jgi:hypothetical protein
MNAHCRIHAPLIGSVAIIGSRRAWLTAAVALSALTMSAFANAQSQIGSLRTFYLNAGGTQWTTKTGWQQFDITSLPAWSPCGGPLPQPLRPWLGISCNASGQIIELRLPNNNLRGTLQLPAPLNNTLTVIDVSQNQLEGALPTFATFPQLTEFNAQSNRFTGVVPPIRRQSAMQSFRIGGNRLHGPAPLPPFPRALTSGGSSLCPNYFTPAASPQTRFDLAWNTATGLAAWSQGCAAATPTVYLCSRDFDGDGAITASTDAILLARGTLAFSAPALPQGLGISSSAVRDSGLALALHLRDRCGVMNVPEPRQ